LRLCYAPNMEAKAFINQKLEAAVEELKAIEAEYKPRRDAAQATISLTKKWLDELGLDKSPSQPDTTIQDIVKSPSNIWAAAKDPSS